MEFAIATKTDVTGFWYRCTGSKGASFQADFVAVGVGSQHTTGELHGAVDEGDWTFHPLGFRTLRVGFSAIDIVDDTPADLRVSAVSDNAVPGGPKSSVPEGARRRRSKVEAFDAELEVFPQDGLAGSFISHNPLGALGLAGGTVTYPPPYPYPYPYPHPPASLD